MSREQFLTRLRSLSAERPTTQMGQVQWAWPEIQAARAAGHTLRLVHERLNEIGIGIGYRTLSLYIGRLERKQGSWRTHYIPAAKRAGKAESRGPAALGAEAGRDPFANIRHEREKKKSAGFEYDAFSINKKLLE